MLRADIRQTLRESMTFQSGSLPSLRSQGHLTKTCFLSSPFVRQLYLSAALLLLNWRLTPTRTFEQDFNNYQYTFMLIFCMCEQSLIEQDSCRWGNSPNEFS